MVSKYILFVCRCPRRVQFQIAACTMYCTCDSCFRKTQTWRFVLLFYIDDGSEMLQDLKRTCRASKLANVSSNLNSFLVLYPVTYRKTIDLCTEFFGLSVFISSIPCSL